MTVSGGTRRGLLLSSLAAPGIDSVAAFSAFASAPAAGPDAWTLVRVAPPGLTDLGAVPSSNVLLSNPDDHAINDFGPAPSGTLRRIIFVGPRGAGIGIDNDRICGPNGIAYNGFPNQFITGSNNLIELLPGDVMEVSCVGPKAASNGSARWQILTYTPHHLISNGLRTPHGGDSMIPPETNYAIGPLGPGDFPMPNGLIVQWQKGIGKTIVGGLVVRGGGGTNGAQSFQMASSGAAGGATVTAAGIAIPISSADIPFGSGSKITFQPFIPDPANAGRIRTAGNDIGFGSGRSPSYIYAGNAVILSGLCLEAPTQNGTGGCFLIEVCKPATTTALQRAWVHGAYGNLVLAGAAAMEAGHSKHGAWPHDPAPGAKPYQWSSPACDVDFLSTPGWGNLSIPATDITDSACGFNAAIAVRKFGAHGEGLDIGYDPAGPGLINRYGVHANVRTPVETFDPSSNVFAYPAQPAFKAYQKADVANATGDGTSCRPLWEAEQYDRNANFSLGIFTAPVGGVYRASASVTLGDYAAARRTGARISLVAGGTTYTNNAGAPVADARGRVTLQIAEDIAMKAGDTAHVAVTVTGAARTVSIIAGVAAEPASRFSISLVG